MGTTVSKAKPGDDAASSAENSVKKKKRRGPGNPDKIRPYQFKPGQSGNPSGRPRRPLTEAYKDLLDKKFPGDARGRTYAQVIAEGQAKAAIAGRTEAAKEIADRAEGKVTQEISGPDGGAIPLDLSGEVTVHERLKSFTERIRDRLAKRDKTA